MATDHPVGLGLLTFADATIDELVEAARFAETRGFDRVDTIESLTDTLAIDLAIACGTREIGVGSFVGISYLRHPVITAQAAVVISEVSKGRFSLGLGIGHKVRNKALGIQVGVPKDDLRYYVGAVRALLNGSGRELYADLPPQHYRGELLQFRVSQYDVPILTAAVGPRMAEVGGAIADGLMLYLQPRTGLAEMREATRRGAQLRPGAETAPELHLGVHAFVADDEELALDQARATLAYWVGMTAYNQRIASTGFPQEAKRIRDAYLADDQERLNASITDEIVREFCIVGAPDECRKQIAAFYEHGADHVTVIPDPVSPGERYTAAVRRVTDALGT